MKKIIFLLLSLFILTNTLLVSAHADDNFLIKPVEKTIESLSYSGNAMRIMNEYVGFRYIVEFDVNMPTSVGKRTAYSLDFNHTTTDTGAAGVSHNSTMTVSDSTWIWTAAGKTVAENLACGTDYRIKIAVDLKEQKQYCSVSTVAEGTVIGYLHGEPIHQAISADADVRVSHQLRWGGAWVDKVNETWGPVQPTNVKLKRNSAYVLAQPTIEFDENTVTANVMTYHNTSTSVGSPVLLLCIYDKMGILVDVAASQIIYEENTTAKPVAREVSISKEVKLTSGMKVVATVLSDFTSRLPFSATVEKVCP